MEANRDMNRDIQIDLTEDDVEKLGKESLQGKIRIATEEGFEDRQLTVLLGRVVKNNQT